MKHIVEVVHDLPDSMLGESYVLSPSTLSRHELESLRKWQPSEAHLYKCGVAWPRPLADLAQDVLHELMRTRVVEARAVDAQLEVLSNDPRRVAKLEVLAELEVRGLASRTQQGVDAWCLTDKGLQCIQLATALSGGQPALRARALPLEDLTTFELLRRLQACGWEPCLFTPQRRKANRPPPYEAGGRKVFWALSTQKTWRHTYLLALLTVPGATGKAVEHFQPNQYYTDLMEGKEYQPRTKANREFTFAFSGMDVVAGDVDAASLAQPELARSSTNSSSSSSSSAPSSSSSSRSSTEGGPTVSRARAGAANLGHEHHGDAAKGEQPTILVGRTQYWHGFRFSTTWSAGQAIGFEAACFQHRERGAPQCRRTREFKKWGGQLEVEKALKWWCVKACQCKGRLEHRDLPDVPRAGLPTLAALESAAVAKFDGDCAGEGDSGAAPSSVAAKRPRCE